MSEDREDEPIFKIDTVPPPAGESDAYSAPTRVGPMLSDPQWAELVGAHTTGGIPKVNETSTSPPAAGSSEARLASARDDGSNPVSTEDAVAAKALAPQALPKIPGYREDEEDDAATMLHRNAAPSMRDTDLADPMFGLPESARNSLPDVEDLAGGGPFSASVGAGPTWQPREMALAAVALLAVAIIGGVIALVAFGH